MSKLLRTTHLVVLVGALFTSHQSISSETNTGQGELSFAPTTRTWKQAKELAADVLSADKGPVATRIPTEIRACLVLTMSERASALAKADKSLSPIQAQVIDATVTDQESAIQRLLYNALARLQEGLASNSSPTTLTNMLLHSVGGSLVADSNAPHEVRLLISSTWIDQLLKSNRPDQYRETGAAAIVAIEWIRLSLAGRAKLFVTAAADQSAALSCQLWSRGGKEKPDQIDVQPLSELLMKQEGKIAKEEEFKRFKVAVEAALFQLHSHVSPN